MTLTMTTLDAPYEYVESEKVVREAIRLTETSDTAIISQNSYSSKSLLRLQGVGKSLWKNVDAQAYVDSLRNEWESR